MSSNERVKRYREKQKALHITKKALQDVTGSVNNVTLDVTPPIVHALLDPEKRKKLEKICQSAKDFNQLENIRYGVSGPTMDIVSELLEVTNATK